jgi:ABC-type branched-subunit amino acid transport system permease subunit
MAVADTVVALGVLVGFYSLVALGLNIKFGHTGLLDFGHVAFFLIGAYTAAFFTLPPPDPNGFTVYLFGLNLPWVVGAVAGMIVAGLVGAFVALPTLRLREDYLAITLLGVAIIALRVVQSEEWIGNGPDALRGIERPLGGTFPVGSGTIEGAVVSLLVAGGIWAFVTYALSRWVSPEGEEWSSSAVFAERLHAVATLGISRRLAASNPDSAALGHRVATVVAELGPSPHVGSAIVAGVVVGIPSAIITLVLPSGMLVWGVVVSLFTWLVLVAAVRRATEDFSRMDLLVSLVLGVAYMLTLAPVYLLDDDSLGIPLTIAAVAVVIWATRYLYRRIPAFSSRPFAFGALTALWWGLTWYFPLQVLTDLRNGAFEAVGSTLAVNTVWVLSFREAEPLIGYSRFLLFLFGTIMFLMVFVSDLIIESPFGRVLRAIRNDEQVVNSLGKDPFMYKVQSMAIGSAITGLAGAMAAIYFQTLVYQMFRPQITFIAFLMVLLGGVANNRGMIVGAAIFWIFQTATTRLTDFVDPALSERVQAFRLVVMGLLFLLILYYRPEGLIEKRAVARGSD